MTIRYTTDAVIALSGVVSFVVSKNTPGAGLRWFDKFESFLLASLNHASTIKLCNNATLGNLQLHCIYFNDWVVAFSISGDEILIEAVLHSSRIRD